MYYFNEGPYKYRSINTCVRVMFGGSQWEPGRLSVWITPERRPLAGVEDENRQPPVGSELRLTHDVLSTVTSSSSSSPLYLFPNIHSNLHVSFFFFF